MSQAVPQTKFSEILDEINGLLDSSESYLSKDDFRVRSLDRQIDDLIQVEAVDGWTLKAVMYNLLGDVESMRKAFDNVVKLGATPPHMQIQCEFNFHFHSRVVELVKERATPESREFLTYLPLLYFCGAFQTLDKMITKSRAMKVDLDPEIQFRGKSLKLGEILEVMPGALKMMEREKIEEAQIAAMLDIAGALIRDKKWFISGEKIVFGPSGDEYSSEVMRFIFAVPCSIEEAVDLDFEFADKVVRAFDNIPENVLVTFRSGVQDAGHA